MCFLVCAYIYQRAASVPFSLKNTWWKDFRWKVKKIASLSLSLIMAKRKEKFYRFFSHIYILYIQFFLFIICSLTRTPNNRHAIYIYLRTFVMCSICTRRTIRFAHRRNGGGAGDGKRNGERKKIIEIDKTRAARETLTHNVLCVRIENLLRSSGNVLPAASSIQQI